MTDDPRTFTQAAAAIGMTPATFSALVRRRGFAGRKSPHHRHAKLISRAELEALVGYQLTDEQWEASKAARAPLSAKARQAKADKQLPQISNELNLDFGWLRFGWEMANDAWLKHLLAHRIDHIEPPPFASELATDMATRDLFTRAELYELLESCVRQRDAQWWEWVNDSVQRAQFPNGPTTLDFKYPEAAEE